MTRLRPEWPNSQNYTCNAYNVHVQTVVERCLKELATYLARFTTSAFSSTKLSFSSLGSNLKHLFLAIE